MKNKSPKMPTYWSPKMMQPIEYSGMAPYVIMNNFGIPFRNAPFLNQIK